jgi:uncharacterized protein YwgA
VKNKAMNSESAFMKKTKKLVTIILAIIFLLVASVFSFYYWGTYSTGVRAGIVMKLSKKGRILKTYEGQLNMQVFGANKSADNQFSQTWEFSVEKSDEDVIKEIEMVALSGERVNLHYIERYSSFPWRGETKYFVQRVERLGASNQ